MTTSFVPRRISGAALLFLAALGAGCRDPQPTYSFGGASGSAGGKAGGSAGGAGGRGGSAGVAGSGGIIGSGSGGIIGSGSGGIIGSGSGGVTGAGSGGTTGAGGGKGGAAGAGIGTGGVSPGSGGGSGTGNTPGSGGTTPAGGTTGNGGAVATGGTGGGAGGSLANGGAGGGSVGGAGGGAVSNVGPDGLFTDDALVAAADFELSSDAAQAAYLDCDPTTLSGNTNYHDAHGNSWGPKALGSLAQQIAFTNLVKAINLTLGGPLGVTGVGNNANNNGPGDRVILGGLLGTGVDPTAITAGTFNGPPNIVALYKAAALADNLSGLTATSSNAAFGTAIAEIGTNQTTSIGLADNVFQCALAAAIGVDSSAVVLTDVSGFKHNAVFDLK